MTDKRKQVIDHIIKHAEREELLRHMGFLGTEQESLYGDVADDREKNHDYIFRKIDANITDSDVDYLYEEYQIDEKVMHEGGAVRTWEHADEITGAYIARNGDTITVFKGADGTYDIDIFSEHASKEKVLKTDKESVLRYLKKQDATKYEQGGAFMLRGGAVGSIEEEAGLLPEVVARMVTEGVIVEKWEEKFGKGQLKMEHDAPVRKEREEWIDYLTQRAEYLFKHNTDFRKKVKGKGNKGRDYLYMMMYHWMGVQDERIGGSFGAKTNYLGAENVKKRWLESVKGKMSEGGELPDRAKEIEKLLSKKGVVTTERDETGFVINSTYKGKMIEGENYGDKRLPNDIIKLIDEYNKLYSDAITAMQEKERTEKKIHQEVSSVPIGEAGKPIMGIGDKIKIKEFGGEKNLIFTLTKNDYIEDGMRYYKFAKGKGYGQNYSEKSLLEAIKEKRVEPLQPMRMEGGGNIEEAARILAYSLSWGKGYFVEELESMGMSVSKVNDYTITAGEQTLCRINYLDSKYYLTKL